MKSLQFKFKPITFSLVLFLFIPYCGIFHAQETDIEPASQAANDEIEELTVVGSWRFTSSRFICDFVNRSQTSRSFTQQATAVENLQPPVLGL